MSETDQAYDDGYHAGYEDGRNAGKQEGFREGKLELLEKIKMMFIADTKTFPLDIEQAIRKEIK